ncbi:MAG: hypothetical protein BWK79_07810 [Beggiatoa sp. IS2]|nr:MAG: hypothetical protein BWK79_07810 [Beggiatoa sp. IS2]
MQIQLLEQYLHFVFSANQQYYRVIFELKAGNNKWSVQIIDLGSNQTVYSTTMDTVIVPDLQLAKEMIKTFATRGTSPYLTH